VTPEPMFAFWTGGDILPVLPKYGRNGNLEKAYICILVNTKNISIDIIYRPPMQHNVNSNLLVIYCTIYRTYYLFIKNMVLPYGMVYITIEII
jgi:hypothetical protein